MVLFCLAVLPVMADDDKQCKDSKKRKERKKWKKKHFKKYDTNNDGKWSKDEWMAKFDGMDADKDGYVTFDEKMAAHKKHKKDRKKRKKRKKDKS